jgi:hypothetical protein
MPNHEQITAARLKAKRIREHASAFRTESAQMEQSIKESLQSPLVIHRKSSLKSDYVRPVGRVA